MKMKLMLIMVMACFVGATVSADLIIELHPAADAWIAHNTLDTNYGDADLLRVGQSGSTHHGRKSYTLWDASHLDPADILAVESIRFYYTGSENRDVALFLLAKDDGIDDNWTEMDITWNYAPYNNVTGASREFNEDGSKGELPPLAIGSFSTGGSAGWKTLVFDAAASDALVAALTSGDYKVTLGLQYNSPAPRTLDFRSRDYDGGARAPVMNVVVGDSSPPSYRPEITPGLAPVLAPIQHQRYYLRERELFGYNPRFTVNTVQFGPDNRPYIRCKPTIHPGGPTAVQTLDDEGNWIWLDFVSALHSFYPHWDGQFLDVYNDATNSDDRIVFDDDDDAYMLVRLSGYGYNLMHSQDLCRTWTVYPLDSNTVDPRLQFRDSYNDLQRPPVIVRRAIRPNISSSINLYVINKNANGTLTLADRQLPTIRILGGGLNGGKGMANLTATKGNKTHIVYAGYAQVGDDQGTPQYVQTYDHTTDTFSDPVYLGSAGVGDPDVHNWPGITIDSEGYLHVVLGAHGAASGQRFRYTQSLVPNSSTDGWTSLVNLAAGLTYLSLVCGTDDALHVVARHHWDPQQKLKYDRKKDGQSWETRRTLVIPFGEREDGRAEYNHYRQNLNIDRLGRLFLTYYSRRRIDPVYPEMRDAYNAKWPCINLPYGHDFIDRPAMLISDDGGDTWRLAVTEDFINGILD